ncbi:hypothetical protein [Streptomyces yangpuensis]|uniref:hypothetical protein n=1 Tax=Streptomyces yangpuensis TaxID=1648182 RepID=UPI000629BD05|nr:hypothetical protein [Streptomyces yangpuensis]
MISTADELLAALAPLPHAARLRYTAVTAHRLAARNGALRDLLTALDARGPYERRLAALAALTGGELGHLAARLGDSDPVVRRYALRGARRLPVPDAAVEAAYDDAPAAVRADLARLLRDGRRTRLAERLALRARTAYGDRDAARLLPGCSPQFAAALLPELAGALAFEDWGVLAARHPAAVLDHAERELAGLPAQLREVWWKQHATALAAALPAAPERVLDLLERHGPDNLPDPVHGGLGHLVAVDAERVARWYADPARAGARWERTPGPAVMRQLVKADPPSLNRLGARWFHRGAFTTLLRSMPPARRPAFVDAVVAAAGPRPNVHVHEEVLALLPAAERHARARAAIEGLGTGGDRGWGLWGPLSLLPPAEARPGLLAALGTCDADDRGSLWAQLSLNAGYTRDPEEVAEILALAAGRLVNERDPVRHDALAAFADLPAPLLVRALGAGAPAAGRSGAASLERLCLDALRARDCSEGTRNTLRTLAVTLLGTAPGTPAGSAALRSAVRMLEALTAHTGTVDLGPEGSIARTGAIRAALDALGPWLDRATAQGDIAPLLAFVTACGRRAHRIPELRHRLEQALRTCPDTHFGDVAEAWLADPATRGARVTELLAREPSVVFLPAVLAVLAAERTDLLDCALPEAPPPGGRFPAAGTARPLPPFRYADRWLPRQQEAAVRLAAAVVADTGRGLDERAALLRAVAPVPEYGRALLQRYIGQAGHSASGRSESGAAESRHSASGRSGSVAADPADATSLDAESAPTALTAVLTAAALDASAHLHDPASVLGALLDHAGDDRAAAAWSAAGRAAAHARPSRVEAVLRDVLTRESGVKVTVRKAAARLAVGHLAPGASSALLSTVARTPGVHQDVHATVVGLAPALLPDEDMWALLESAAAHGPDVARRALLDRGPTALAPAHRSRYGELVARLPLVAEECTANAALGVLEYWAPYAPAAGRVLADVYTDLASPLSEWRARSGLTQLAQSELPHPLGGVAPGSLLHGVVERLLALIAAGEPEGGGPGGDLPARRRLDSLLASWIRDHRMCAALARRLANEPQLTATRTALLVRAVDLAGPEPDILLALRELAAAIGDRPVLAGRVAEDLKSAHRYGEPLAAPAAALAATGSLGGDGGLVEGLLAVGLATALGIRHNWPETCRATVVALRRHPEPEVRETAYATVLDGH